MMGGGSVEWLSSVRGIFIVSCAADVCQRAQGPALKWKWELVIDMKNQENWENGSDIEWGGWISVR